MKKIVILGAGYAGIKTAVELQKKIKGKAKIILVDRHDYHYETTRLVEVATGAIPYTKMSYQIADVLKPEVSQLIVDEVVKIDPDQQKVALKKHDSLSYDYLVVGLGFVLSNFGIEGADQYALPMHDVASAEKIRDHVVSQMKAYRQDKKAEHLQIVVCGAGFQAIELATGLSTNRERYAKIAGCQPEQIKVTSIDGSPRLLPMFDDKQMHYALSLVAKAGVKIIRPARVVKIEQDGVSYKMNDDDKVQKIATRTPIWMMGFSGSPVIAQSGFKNRRGKVLVDDHLTDPAHANIYLLGDVSNVMVPGKKWPWPNTAQLALSMAGYAAKDLAARINGQSRPKKYAYHDLGVVVAIGDTHAAAYAMGHNYRGYLASALKKIIADKSLMETGGLKETLAVGRFDLYH